MWQIGSRRGERSASIVTIANMAAKGKWTKLVRVTTEEYTPTEQLHLGLRMSAHVVVVCSIVAPILRRKVLIIANALNIIPESRTRCSCDSSSAFKKVFSTKSLGRCLQCNLKLLYQGYVLGEARGRSALSKKGRKRSLVHGSHTEWHRFAQQLCW
jgi:hypothetical protein